MPKVSKTAPGTSEDRRKALVREHLPYELQMLRFTFGRLNSLVSDTELSNALIESFAIHARNLTCFLQGKETVLPRYLTSGTFKTKSTIYETGLLDKINIQVCHIGDKRGSAAETKLTGIDRDKIYQGIEAEMLLFIAALDPKYRWSNPPTGVVEMPPSVPSATNYITSSGTKLSEPGQS